MTAAILASEGASLGFPILPAIVLTPMIGALVIAVIANGLGLLNLPAGVNYIVTGGVLILAATVDAVSRVRAGGSLLRT